jgi:hypothetical protein
MPATYLFLGTERWTDMVLVRALLQGFNSWGRQWNEINTIQGNGSLAHLEDEVSVFHCLKYQEVTKLRDPNVVIGFMEPAGNDNGVAYWLDEAYERQIPCYSFGSWSGPLVRSKRAGQQYAPPITPAVGRE